MFQVYIGCAADILPQVDARCSGRQNCEIDLPDSALHRQQPCPKDMVVYLEAAYKCVKGNKPRMKYNPNIPGIRTSHEREAHDTNVHITEDVMFSVALVGFSVCLYVRNITHKVMNGLQ